MNAQEESAVTNLDGLESESATSTVTEPAGPVPATMEEYLDNLPAAEAEAVRRTSVPATITKSVATTPAFAQSVTSGTPCYMSSTTYASKNAVGVILIKWNLTHAWCIRNNRVVSAGPSAGGIIYAGYGWKDMNQDSFQGAVTNYGWRGRSLGKYKASWAPSGVHLFSATNCARMINDTNSRITYRGTGCTL